MNTMRTRLPVKVTVLEEVLAEGRSRREELREYRFTKVKVTLVDDRVIDRELVTLRLNPWWFPHDLYTPKADGTGGPFTIGRVIHSSRSVGFTGWIGGVAVFEGEERMCIPVLCNLDLPNSHCKVGFRDILAAQREGGSHGL